MKYTVTNEPQTDVGEKEGSTLREASLPKRVVVGANGAYWRDYTDDPMLGGYSMCPVSEDNDPVVPVAIYVREEALSGVARDLDVERLALGLCEADKRPCDMHRADAEDIAARYRAATEAPDPRRQDIDARRAARGVPAAVALRSRNHRCLPGREAVTKPNDA